MLLAARLAGDRLREHVQGTDLVLMLASESAKNGHRWFLLGGQGTVAERAALDEPLSAAPPAEPTKPADPNTTTIQAIRGPKRSRNQPPGTMQIV